jgi:hypothetical protein
MQTVPCKPPPTTPPTDRRALQRRAHALPPPLRGAHVLAHRGRVRASTRGEVCRRGPSAPQARHTPAACVPRLTPTLHVELPRRGVWLLAGPKIVNLCRRWSAVPQQFPQVCFCGCGCCNEDEATRVRLPRHGASTGLPGVLAGVLRCEQRRRVALALTLGGAAQRWLGDGSAGEGPGTAAAAGDSGGCASR